MSMSEHEGITGELRAAGKVYAGVYTDMEHVDYDKPTLDRLFDNIDAVHASLERENESLRRELDRVLGEMEEHHAWAPESHYVMLPKDADGEPWHINDEFEINEGIAHVNGIGDNRLFYIDNDGMQWTRADNKLHYRAPTVEDVLREFALAVCKDDALTIRKDVVDEYAAKLQLSDADA